jgi:peptide-methionine (S)-S-oxide reductase
MSIFTKCVVLLSIVVAVGCGVINSSAKKVEIRDLEPSNAAENGDHAAAAKGTQVAVFAGGCFWGVDAVFKHVKGVIDVKSGYSGGDLKNPRYEQVGEGTTGHAESVKVTFDPAKVTYVQLLTVFFSVAHDPTELNRQGPDTGTQYRSAIFYANEEQKKLAEDYIQAIDKAKAFSKPVVTQVAPLKQFYEAEDYHQNYLALHPKDPYIVYNDIPKVEALKAKFPDLYVEK